MHRFFLTDRTLYVIVVNARDNTQNERARYWLNNVKSFANDCPVIIVLNKMDQNKSAGLNETLLKSDYPQIKGILKSVLELQKEMKNKFFWVYFVTISIGVLLSFGISILFTRPIKILTAATEQIAGGKYGEQITYKKQDEIGQLAVNFNRMSISVQGKVEELSEAARQKEDFAANFAHELKTPLTSIIGYADRIYQKDLPREEQKQAAWFIWNEGMRLEALSQKTYGFNITKP